MTISMLIYVFCHEYCHTMSYLTILKKNELKGAWNLNVRTETVYSVYVSLSRL